MRAFSSPPDTIFTLAAYTEGIQARRFLFYSHDGLGLGDVRRSLGVARELSELSEGASVLLVTGAEEVESLGLPARVGVLKLPGFETRDRASAGRLQLPFGEVRMLREKILATAVETFQPEVVLVDRHPFGIGGELGPALEIARASGARAVLGLCDVFDDPATIDVEWHARGVFQRIAAYYSRVLVYGQPDVIDPVRNYEFPDDVAAITSFCGYVVSASRSGRKPLGAEDAPASRKRERPRVLATGGGGADGFPVLQAFVEAAAGAGWRATVVAGPECPPGRVKWLDGMASEAGISFRRFVPSLPAEFSSLDALVCMGGYNTLAEAAASGVPTVCVPRVRPRSEQLIRAEAFSARGLLRLIEPDKLDAEILRAEIDSALTRADGPRARLDLGGGRRAAHHLLELASQRASRPRSKAALVALG
jgi:predicted glycosyltransferase